MHLVLTLISGIGWTIVYAVCIRIGFAQRTYAIPCLALALNISWEILYALHGLTMRPDAQTIVDIVWAAADVVIVITFIRFGRKELPGDLSRPVFGAWVVLLLGSSAYIQVLFADRFGFTEASHISAFLMNVLMSGLFLSMNAARGSRRGQSLLIAYAKCVGTLAATALFGVLDQSGFITGLGIITAVLDVVYIVVLTRTQAAPGRPASAAAN